MVQVQEIRLQDGFSVYDVLRVLGQLKESNVLRLVNNRIDIKVLKIDVGIILYLVFGEHYVVGSSDDGDWKNVVYVTDDIDRLAYFIHGL
jgi:hypothetical protein